MTRPKSDTTKRTASGMYESQRRAIARNDEKLKSQVDDIRLRVPKGWKDTMKEYAAAAGYGSVNNMLCDLIRREIPDIENDNNND